MEAVILGLLNSGCLKKSNEQVICLLPLMYTFLTCDGNNDTLLYWRFLLPCPTLKLGYRHITAYS